MSDETIITTEEMTFPSTEERDAYITQHFPQRRGSDVPGLYFLPKGRQLYVHFTTISFTTQDDPEKELDYATRAAVDAAAEVIAVFSPDITSGDIDPDALARFEQETRRFIKHWVDMNRPVPDERN